MTPIPVLFGTESGNAEMALDDIVEALAHHGHPAEVFAMDEFDVPSLSNYPVVVIITSTYGEGELPETALPCRTSLGELERGSVPYGLERDSGLPPGHQEDLRHFPRDQFLPRPAVQRLIGN